MDSANITAAPPEELLHKNEPIKVFSCIFKDGEGFPWHWHTEFEINYIKAGRGSYGLDFQQLDAEKGDLIIISSEVPHSVLPNSGSIEALTLVFDPSVLQSVFHDSADMQYIVPIVKKNVTVVQVIKNIGERYAYIPQVFDKLIELYEAKPSAYTLLLKSLVYQVVATLCSDGYIVPSIDGAKPRTRKQDAVKTVLQYMDAQYAQPIYLQQLAALVNFDGCYLTRLFKETLGCSCMGMLTRIRMHKAIELLRDTDMSVTSISLETGFADLSFFQRQFKRYYCVTPLQWRRKNKQLNNDKA